MSALHVVTGKGGTGKTTVALALATSLAAGAARVLVCEVEGRNALTAAVGQPATPLGREMRLRELPGVWGLGVDPRQALQEYLDRNFRLGLAGKALDRAGLVEFATTIAPGLRDVLLIGKIYDAARSGGFDAVVLDAPPTGRVAGFLTAGDAIGDVAKVGPVHAQAGRIMSYLRANAVVHLVATLAEMPVTETVEATAGLRGTGLRLGGLVVNRAAAPVPAGRASGVAPATAAILDEVLTDARGDYARQQQWLPELSALGMAITRLPELPSVEAAGIVTLASRLGRLR